MNFDSLKPYLGSLVRALLLLLAGLLVGAKTPILNMVGDTLKSNVNTVTLEVVGFIVTLGTILWGWWQKRKQKVVVETALELPPRATEADLKEAVKEKSVL